MISITGPEGQVLWTAFPKQEEALLRNEFEVLFGGARGGAKTDAGIIFLIMGNPRQSQRNHVNASYINHPQYRALVLRKNATDMDYWIDRAKRIYQPLGAEFKEKDRMFVWPSGAKFVLGHLAEDGAYEKYQGPEYQRILVEELTQIPNEDLYLKLFGCCRSKFPELRKQLFLTTNPGGVGHGWVRGRFVHPRMPQGQSYVPGTTWTNPATGLTRVFIPASVRDNPIYANDTHYIAELMELPPMTRKAWLDGDWDAIAGVYFEEFRAKALPGEPAEALHVYEDGTRVLAPWWPRWLACDWGYSHNAAVYKACLAPSGQIHVYDELVVNHTTPEELGSQIAHWASDEFSSELGHMNLWLSPDAFSKRQDERTIAHQIAAGMQLVLGPDSVYVPELEEFGTGDLLARRELQVSSHITIRRAPNQRVAGWQFMHSMLRWWPILPSSNEKFDPAYAAELFAHPNGMQKYKDYLRLFTQETETLPRVVFSSRCAKVIDAIPKARANDPERGDPEDIDKKHFDGMDSLDAVRYLLFAFKRFPVKEPFDSFYQKHLEKHSALSVEDGNSRVWMARKAEEDWKKLQGPTDHIHLTRAGGRARRQQALQDAADLRHVPVR